MSTPTKCCSKCKREFPATNDNFYSKSDGKYGIRSICIECTLRYEQERRRTPEHQEYMKNYRVENRDVLSAYMQEYHSKPENKARSKEQTRISHAKPESRSRHKQYVYNYYRTPAYRKRERERRKGRINELRIYQRDYKRQHGSVFHQRRKANLSRLPNTFTKLEWQNCKDYFHNQCAVCGQKKPLAIDHWIAVSDPDCPGNVAANIVPLCKSCNSSKNNKSAATWLADILGNKATEVLQQVEAYFSSLTT